MITRFVWGVAVVASSTPAAAAAQHRLGGGGSLDISLTRIVFALLFCLALAIAVVLLIKRGGGRIDLSALRSPLAGLTPPMRRIQVIETRRISVHADLCLLRCDNREYLVLSSAAQQQVLESREVTA